MMIEFTDMRVDGWAGARWWLGRKETGEEVASGIIPTCGYVFLTVPFLKSGEVIVMRARSIQIDPSDWKEVDEQIVYPTNAVWRYP